MPHMTKLCAGNAIVAFQYSVTLATNPSAHTIEHLSSSSQATRDFAVEAAQLSEALAQKEEEVQMTGQHIRVAATFFLHLFCVKVMVEEQAAEIDMLQAVSKADCMCHRVIVISACGA